MSITSLLGGVFKSRQTHIDAYTHNSEEIQRRVMTHLVQQGQRTQYGKTWGMNNVRTYEDFANRMPVTTYEELKGPIDRMRHGEADVLWPGAFLCQIVGYHQRQKQVHPCIGRWSKKYSL